MGCSCWYHCGIPKKPFHAMQNHCAQYCPQRHVPCPLGCSEPVSMHRRREHVLQECSQRLRQYVWGLLRGGGGWEGLSLSRRAADLRHYQ
jgi:hypothetical protein